MTVVSEMVSAVVSESEFISTETFVTTTIEKLDVYQNAIFDFIMFNNAEFSIDAQLEIVMAISNFNSAIVISELSFAEIFVGIFSETSEFYTKIVKISESSSFVAIETVATVISTMTSLDSSFNILDVTESSMSGQD